MSAHEKKRGSWRVRAPSPFPDPTSPPHVLSHTTDLGIHPYSIRLLWQRDMDSLELKWATTCTSAPNILDINHLANSKKKQGK